ncbi:hypothetical protein CW734_04595 [Planococcus sp. MB-3u-03]|nr:hypothetical protein CW734_04595 [Planococcus sp. MB-3u-03]
MHDARFKQDAIYLIRPVGHVALAPVKQWLRLLNMYLETFSIVAFEWSEIEIIKETREMNP